MDELRQALKEFFGHDDFREGQREIVEAAVAGVDTLAPGAERRYEATWPRPTRGTWVMRAGTVNTTGPRASSVAPLVVP